VVLPCSFWLADNYWILDRRDEAHERFERLLALINDVGLYTEEFCPKVKWLLGNFPQAFTHVAMVSTALNLSRQEERPARKRRSQ
jgi:GH15 family glucan-1,4-alpha-glucosidase